MLPSAAAPTPPPSGEIRKYKGVRLRKWGRWVSEIRLPNSRERIWLGSYDTPEKAARAFDAAYLCLRGGAGGTDGLNFPSSPPAVGLTSNPEEVRAAAMSHANRVSSSAAAAPWEATDRRSEPTPAYDGAPVETAVVGAPPAPPLQVSAEVFDWSEIMANPPPLFSPTVVGSHAHLPAATLTPPTDDVDVDMMEENAARAFDAAYLCLRGGAGGTDGLNFPSSPPDVVRRTCDPVEVQATAVSHANGAAASPWNAAEPSSEPTQAHHHGREPAMETTAAPSPAPAAALESLQVSVKSFDWSQLLMLPDDLPPLFSPTEMGSHAYLPAAMSLTGGRRHQHGGKRKWLIRRALEF